MPSMDLLAELAQTFLTSLYTLRVPIAIGSVIAFAGFVWVARRRGWFAAARRHPGRTAALAVVVLAVGLPVGWYLGSPLFIRTALVEPAPSAVPTPAVTNAPAAGAPSAPIAAPTLGPTLAPPTLRPERTGTFTGADDFHFGSGTARLIETAPGSWVVRFEDFSVRNGPDLYVYLSPDPDGYADDATELGTLKATDGDFNYEVPAGTDVAAARSVVVWCKQFAVMFAHAELR
jgi:hypothetical protein